LLFLFKTQLSGDKSTLYSTDNAFVSFHWTVEARLAKTEQNDIVLGKIEGKSAK
jgi:hypothetical protein